MNSLPSPRPNGVELQVARLWAATTAIEGGLALADPDLPSSANPAAGGADLFGVAMPTIDHRAELAAAITRDGAPDVSRGTSRVRLRVEAHGPSLGACDARLADLVSIIGKGGARVDLSGAFNDGTTKMHGVVGAGPIVRATPEGEDVDLWRVLHLGVVVGVQHRSIELGPGSSPDGQAVSQVGLVALAHPARLAAPETAFEIVYDGPLDPVAASVRITEESIVLCVTEAMIETETVALGPGVTVADLAASIGALADWSVTGEDAAFENRDARSVIDTRTHDATAGNVPVRIWA